MLESNPEQTARLDKNREERRQRTPAGGASWLARFSMAVLLFETITGLAITLAPFHPSVQYGVLVHTALGALTLLPVAWYCLRHWPCDAAFRASAICRRAAACSTLAWARRQT